MSKQLIFQILIEDNGVYRQSHTDFFTTLSGHFLNQEIDLFLGKRFVALDSLIEHLFADQVTFNVVDFIQVILIELFGCGLDAHEDQEEILVASVIHHFIGQPDMRTHQSVFIDGPVEQGNVLWNKIVEGISVRKEDEKELLGS